MPAQPKRTITIKLHVPSGQYKEARKVEDEALKRLEDLTVGGTSKPVLIQGTSIA